MDLWKFSAQPSKRDSKLGADFFLKNFFEMHFWRSFLEKSKEKPSESDRNLEAPKDPLGA